MSLRTSLLIKLLFVTLFTVAAMIGWVIVDAQRSAVNETRATFLRSAEILSRNHYVDLQTRENTRPERVATVLLTVMSPGTCIEYEMRLISRRRVCAGWSVFGPIAPSWFRRATERVFTAPAPLVSEITQTGVYSLSVSFDRVALATRAWQRTSLALTQALLVSCGILLLWTGAVLHSVRPVDAILSEIERLASGDLEARIVPAKTREFRRIGLALNDLGARLQDSVAQRRALMRRLLEVTDAERRQLARDLHDEFGQTLTATNALAASISVAAADRPDIVTDASAIGRNIRAMMGTLRGAFARLRPPDLEEVGLAASIRTMLAGWQRSDGGPRLILDCPREPQNLPGSVALDLYRIVQECVTNAMRHGHPTRIHVALSSAEDAESLRLVVEDDGGGAVGRDSSGQGLLGIRERAASLGARLSVGNTGTGVRVEVEVPGPSGAIS